MTTKVCYPVFLFTLYIKVTWCAILIAGCVCYMMRQKFCLDSGNIYKLICHHQSEFITG